MNINTIDSESNRNRKLPLNIDFMSERYVTSNGYFIFTSPSLWTIEKNLFYLLKNSKKKDLAGKYIMRPDYLSYDEYDTIVLAQLLMYVNGIMCVEEFTINQVVIPKLSAIIKITEDNFSQKNLIQVDW